MRAEPAPHRGRAFTPIWGIFLLKLGDPAAAGRESLRIGPITWSFLQLLLLLIAQERLRRMGRSLRDVIGLSVKRLPRDLVKALSLAAVSVFIIVLITRSLGRILSEGSPFHPWALVWWTTVGLLLGWTYMREGRLWPVILAHIFTDMTGGVPMLLGWA